jgi:hypothetical protein
MKSNINSYQSVNYYFHDEARFGMMKYLRKYLTACGVKPIVKINTFIKLPISMVVFAN